ncbi:MAG: efflux RND transporter periplasmic adaptor subunit, partial [bacterium]|nr:efflux RND transporter periplasmic adaptor subunit [bacterium]
APCCARIFAAVLDMTPLDINYKRRAVGCSLLVILLVFSVAFGIAVVTYVRQKLAPVEVAPAPPVPPLFIVAPTNLVRLRAYPAELRADKTAVLSAAVDGDILAVYIEIGDCVTQGQVLVEIDPRYKRIAVDEARAVLLQAQIASTNAATDLSNNQRLFASNVIGDEALRKSRVAYHVTKALLEQAHAALARALEQLIDCTIPKISARAVERGNRVNTMGGAQALVSVVDDRRLRLTFYVEDRDILCVREDAPVLFTVDSLANGTCTARVAVVGTDIEPETRMYRVEAFYDNTAGRLKPGMIARVQIPIRTYTAALFIPLYAVRPLDNGDFVTVYLPPSNRLARVTLADEVDDLVLVTDGIAAGDALILQ